MIAAVGIMGAESTGKTTLCQALATHYQTVWIPEYLRDFCDEHQRVPVFEEEWHIACMQLEKEKAYAEKAHRFLFCDTTPLQTWLYSRCIFGKSDVRLDQLVQQHDYFIIFVTAPDFPWQADGIQRDSPEAQIKLHQMICDELEVRAIPYVLLEGSKQERLDQASSYLEFLTA